jgi:hypothetical protein
VQDVLHCLLVIKQNKTSEPAKLDLFIASSARQIRVAAALAVGWFVYTHIVPHPIQDAFQPLASKPHYASPTVQRVPLSETPVRVSFPSVSVGSSQQELTTKRQAEWLAIAELKRQKDRAWAAYYSPPASCEHPADWNAQVECGNQYMRAKKAFETQWSKDHSPGDSVAPPVLLDNRSITAAGR